MPSCLTPPDRAPYFEWPPSEVAIDATEDITACPDCNTVHRVGTKCPRCWDRQLKAEIALTVARQIAREQTFARALDAEKAKRAPKPDENAASRREAWLFVGAIAAGLVIITIVGALG